MTHISITTLNPSRWEEAKILRLEALQQDPSAFGSSYDEEVAFEDHVWKTRLETAVHRDNIITLYAEFNGQLVGMMGAGWSKYIKYKHIASIYAVYVTPSMRGRSIGSQLLHTLLDELATIPQIEKVKLMVTTNQSAAIALYEKSGFKSIGIAQKDLKVDGQYYGVYYMEKHLS
jgi:ribosomal protein S18 acetylase RimI-like enzyme